LCRASGGELEQIQLMLGHASGGELEQIQLMLGHASVQTTGRYLGTKQDLIHPPN
jgi:integrase/recombinase XerD